MKDISIGTLADVLVALQKDRISLKGLDQFRKGGILNQVAEAMRDGDIRDMDLSALLTGFQVPDYPLSESQQMAQEIMGKNFISPAAFCKALYGRIKFSDEELEQLAVIPWSEEVLREEAEQGAILFPTHPSVTLPFLRGLFGVNPNNQPCIYNGDWWLGSRGDTFRDKNLGISWRLGPHQVCGKLHEQDLERATGDDTGHSQPYYSTRSRAYVPVGLSDAGQSAPSQGYLRLMFG